jgi:hypothetical protein
MMSNVIDFTGKTTIDLDPNEMLTNAMEEYQFKGVVLVGWHGDDQFTVCSSMGASTEIVYALELGKKAILDASTG